MGIDNGEMCINFCLNAYPDIEASRYEPDADIENLGFGSNLHFSERFIYRWHTTHPWSDVSTNPIPLTQAALRDKLYPFVKSINPFFADAVDIIEEDSN